MSLQEVVIAPAKAINRPDLGYLAIFNMRKGNFGFVDFCDKAGDKVMGDQKLECELTLRAGEIVWDLNGISSNSWKEE